MKLSLEKISPYLAKSLGIEVAALSQCFVRATEADLDEIMMLRTTLYAGDTPWDDRQYLKWRYRFEQDSENCLWVFRLTEKLVACIGVEKVVVHAGDATYDAYKLMDILVDPELDGKGLGAWMNLRLMQHYPLLIAVGANEKSRSLVTRLFKPLPALDVYKLPVKSARLLKKNLIVPVLPNLLALPLDAYFWLRRKAQWYSTDDITVKQLKAIPEEVSAFIAGRKSSIAVTRSVSYLDWRYLQNPRVRFDVLGVYRGDKLIGLSVSHRYFSAVAQYPESVIFDWLVLESSGNTNEKIVLQQTAAHQVVNGAVTVTVPVHCKQCSASLLQSGFLLRDTSTSFFVHASDQDVLRSLTENQAWFITEGDFDIDNQ